MIVIEPSSAEVSACRASSSTHVIKNTSNQRLTFKVKSTNNDNYRVSVVYGFLEPVNYQVLQINRTNGPAREDRFVVQYAAASPEENCPEKSFKSSTKLGEAAITLTARDSDAREEYDNDEESVQESQPD